MNEILSSVRVGTANLFDKLVDPEMTDDTEINELYSYYYGRIYDLVDDNC